jgi:hypothetical protein
MPGKTALKRLAALILLGVAVFVFRSWLESHDDQLQLKATFEAQKKLISAADTREQNRASELKDTLAQIAAEKRAIQTPQQIANALRQFIPLPQPIEFTPIPDAAVQQGTAKQETEKGTAASEKPDATGADKTGSRPDHLETLSPQPAAQSLKEQFTAQLPTADLKPLYDFMQDCRACQAQLSAAHADLVDERARSAAISTERDAALRAAKGGNFWTRIKRNAKWFVLGAGFGAAATMATRH